MSDRINLTDEEIKEFYLNHVKITKCEVCFQDTMVYRLPSDIVASIIYIPSDGMITPTVAVPCLTIACETCGNTKLLNIRMVEKLLGKTKNG